MKKKKFWNIETRVRDKKQGINYKLITMELAIPIPIMQGEKYHRQMTDTGRRFTHETIAVSCKRGRVQKKNKEILVDRHESRMEAETQHKRILKHLECGETLMG